MEEVGEGVKKWKKGDKVTPTFFSSWYSGPWTSDSGHGGPVDGVAGHCNNH